MSLLFDHLWQSTLLAAALGLLTLAFRRNAASVRYGLWFAASVKFLLPFSALTALGETLFRAGAPAYSPPPVFYRMASVAQPFSDAHGPAVAAAAPNWSLATILFVIWAIGFVALSALWLVRWARMNAMVRAARVVSSALPLPVKASRGLLEPGLVGIWRPVLVIPEGILERLSPQEIAAIVAHERCHMRRRDNLTAAIHMLTANLFWFHPLMWWMGARLIEERERACDEAVLAEGNDPKAYANGILKVCAFYVRSPLDCAAGVSGANLTKRMETIMENSTMLRLNTAKKTMLAALAASVIAVPVVIGLASSGRAAAAEAQPANAGASHAVIAMAPAQFDKFAGYYRINGNVVYDVSRRGDHFFAGAIGERPDRIYPVSANAFVLKGSAPPAQYSFTTDAAGHVTEMVLHQSGAEVHAPRISEEQGKIAEAALAQRIASNTPSPWTRQALRHQIEGLRSGHPDYSKMAPSLAAGTRQMLGMLHKKVAAWGPVSSINFVGVGKNGMDVYEVTCRNARSKWEIGPLTADGKISAIFFSEES